MTITLDTLLVSDTHFDHRHIEKFCPSRQKIIELSNKSNSPEDILFQRIWEENEGKTIFHLGDFAFKGINKYKERLEKTNTILLKGNHDKKIDKHYLYNGFSEVIEGINIFQHDMTFKTIESLPSFCNAYIKEFNGTKVFFSHFPLFHKDKHDMKKPFYKGIEIMENLYEELKCDINIHGHTHEQNSIFKNSFNVSVENIDFKPISIREILEYKG